MGQSDSHQKKKPLLFGIEAGYSACEWIDDVYTTYHNDSFYDKLDRFFYLPFNGFLVGGLIIYNTKVPEWTLESGILYQQKGNSSRSNYHGTIVHYLIVPVNAKLNFLSSKRLHPFLQAGIYNALGIGISGKEEFGKLNTGEGFVSRYDIGMNYGLGMKYKLNNNHYIELWGRGGIGRIMFTDCKYSTGGSKYYVGYRCTTLEAGMSYLFLKQE